MWLAASSSAFSPVAPSLSLSFHLPPFFLALAANLRNFYFATLAVTTLARELCPVAAVKGLGSVFPILDRDGGMIHDVVDG